MDFQSPEFLEQAEAYNERVNSLQADAESITRTLAERVTVGSTVEVFAMLPMDTWDIELTRQDDTIIFRFPLDMEPAKVIGRASALISAVLPVK